MNGKVNEKNKGIKDAPCSAMAGNAPDMSIVLLVKKAPQIL
jgi:hypothetical protein